MTNSLEVQVASYTGTTIWTGDDGTSFAAPAMAGLGALVKETCGGTMNHNQLRAILKSAAYNRNPNGWRYSTPAYPLDQKDGGGALLAGAALAFCGIGSGGPTVFTGSSNISVTKGSGLPKGSSPAAGSPPPGGAKSDDQLRIENYAAPGPGDGRIGGQLLSVQLSVGERFRVTFAWDACPVASMGAGPDKVATDIDIFLYNATTSSYLYGSQSVDDNTEGFDVTIPSGQGGVYTLYYGLVPGTGCNGVTSEPAAWAGLYGNF
jgi:hypothetical protein